MAYPENLDYYLCICGMRRQHLLLFADTYSIHCIYKTVLYVYKKMKLVYHKKCLKHLFVTFMCLALLLAFQWLVLEFVH